MYKGTDRVSSTIASLILFNKNLLCTLFGLLFTTLRLDLNSFYVLSFCLYCMFTIRCRYEFDRLCFAALLFDFPITCVDGNSVYTPTFC